MSDYNERTGEYEPEVSGDYKTRLLLTQKDLDRMRETVEKWQADPTKILEWADDQSKMALLILSHIMTHPRGRSGPYHSMRAADSIAKMIDAIVRLQEATNERIQGREKAPDGPMGISGDGEPEHSAEERRPGGQPYKAAPGNTAAGEMLGLADIKGPRYGKAVDMDQGRTGQEEPD